jgi:hypothetical protein
MIAANSEPAGLRGAQSRCWWARKRREGVKRPRADGLGVDRQPIAYFER